jgi:prephenate dehydrogenase
VIFPTDQAPLRDAPVASMVVVGLGLVGGSIARAARAAGVRVVGVDRPSIVGVARDEGFVDESVVLDDDGAVAAAVGGAGMTLLALPVLGTTAFLTQHGAALRDVLVTDTAPTKRDVVRCAARLGLRRFVGGHPMLPRAHGGLASADAALLDDARWFLCAAAADDHADAAHIDESALTRVRAFVGRLGAVPVEVAADEHDRDVALTSHVPHLLANALAEAVVDAGALEAAGASLREILRVAGAPFDVWGDTVQTNQRAIGAALDEVIARLQGLRGALDDRERVRELFATGRALRERLHG